VIKNINNLSNNILYNVCLVFWPMLVGFSYLLYGRVFLEMICTGGSFFVVGMSEWILVVGILCGQSL
jgi:hypothetical protein